MSSNIATRWRVLSGENKWEGLLDPLDIDLRRYIIHYGERVQAVLDAFVSDTRCWNFGLHRYAERNLFSEVGLAKGNPYKYVIKKYIYASAAFMPENILAKEPKNSAGNSKWIGFVAVTTDEGMEVLGRRDILISWRGTLGTVEVEIDKKFGRVPASEILDKENDPQIHEGWYNYYTWSEPSSKYNPTSSRDQVLAAVRELVDQYKDEEISITVTGHSMGAAIGTLNATDIVVNGYNKPKDQPNKTFPVTAIVFASPRLGDKGFLNCFSNLKHLNVLRVTNDLDPVPKLPPNLILGYEHVGQELVIDTTKSEYLKNPITTLHELEVYLHGVAGTQGKTGGFKLEVARDLTLVNKTIDGLSDKVPSHIFVKWWTEKVEKKMGMAQLDDGSWVFLDGEIAEDNEVAKL
ncbi:hypothetical protein UlMin_001888 [Ulmus minor]